MMDVHQLTNFVDTHSRPVPVQDAQNHGSVLSLAPFLKLTRELAVLLVPVQLRADFRVELHRSLVASARQQQAQLALDIAPPGEPAGGAVEVFSDRVAHLLALVPTGVDRRLVVGAAAVGGAVSLGILAYVLSHRERPAVVA
jgi:hypothetical protein